jgi:hypothetical protein
MSLKKHHEAQIQTLAQELHKDWVKNFLKTGGTERFKPVPGSEGWTKEERQETIKKDPTARLGINKEGAEVVEQNIAQSPKNIYPSLMEALNGKLAREYFDALNGFVGNKEKAAEIVHNIWMKENSWQKESSPQLFVSYSELSEEEKDKDRAVVKVMEDLKKKEVIIEI